MKKTLTALHGHVRRIKGGWSAEQYAGKGAHKSRSSTKEPMLMRFPVSEQILFAKRLSMMLRSGTPILEGLTMMSNDVRSRTVAHVYGVLITHVAKGQPLSSGLAKFSRQFGMFAINIIEVGEKTGTLPDNLSYLADELKKNQALRKKVIGALVYPIVIVLATTGITGFLTIYIFPKITPIFASFHTTLPLSTRILIAVSQFLIKDGIWLVLGLILASVALFFTLRVEAVRYRFDRFLLSLPVLGKVIQYYNVVNITRTLGLLISCDVRVVESFDIVAKSTKNLVFKRVMKRAATHVMKGQKIAEQFRGSAQIFPSMVPQMLAVGEATGNLTGSLRFCAEMYDEEIDDLTKNLTNLLEPVLMIVMGLVVGFVAVSIITPIYGITQNITPYH